VTTHAGMARLSCFGNNHSRLSCICSSPTKSVK